ncbi:hypothetical protein M9H77_36371 [Catharanthus roseus]|uniref:Uncharacterized protein n=1 Tax=Catharanthus roseus TaxID=4058 RepID=A0ACB9ZU78_CATRO|nr:hypothetical protein M9H77_36371 [Catharanthus roseus]
MGVRLFVIERLNSVWLVLTTRYQNLIPMASFWGSGLYPCNPTVALHVLLNLGIEAASMCLNSLRLLSCARNPHCGSRIVFHCGAYKLVLRDTQMPYSTAVDLVAELGASQHIFLILKKEFRYKRDKEIVLPFSEATGVTEGFCLFFSEE